MSDINLIYSGGSGGFLLLHLLLLSGRYTVALKNNFSIDKAVIQQWDIKDSNRWKENEFWPSNTETKLLKTDLNKIYFYCNTKLPTATPTSKLVVVYTDYASQQLLAYYKKANWYMNRTKPAFDFKFTAFVKLLRTWRNHYNNIKDPSWPPCVSFRHIDRLPNGIQQELLNDPQTEYFLNYRYPGDDTVLHCGTVLYNQAAEYVASADIAIKLQDIVNSGGQVLVDAFNIPPINSSQQELIAHWCRLHPQDLLDSIGIYR